MTAEHRVKEALGCVRKANAQIETLQLNKVLLHPTQMKAELGKVRVELSVAAGHLAHALDDGKGGS